MIELRDSRVPTVPARVASSPAVDPKEQRRVARLLFRAGFGGSVADINTYAAKGYKATVDQLLNFTPFAQRPADHLVTKTAVETEARLTDSSNDISYMQSWWLRNMVLAGHPLEEKLTLYWHGHFTSAYTKVKSGFDLARQNIVQREFAAGDFRQFAKRMTQDPAMLYYLDGNKNIKGKPNENYAREFMELFTLGPARYSQRDVREAARALTGLTADSSGNSGFDANLHDAGPKTILGNGPAKWMPTDLADIVLDHHPQGKVAASYVARRVAGFFYSPNVEQEIVDAMARAFSGATGGVYSIRDMLRVLFMRPEFIDGPHVTIKSPAELVAGVIKALSLDPSNDKEMVTHCNAMGQQLFNPPNVSGWRGGAAWASTATVLARYNFASRVGELVSQSLQQYPTNTLGTAATLVQQWMDMLGLLNLSDQTRQAIDGYLGSAQKANDSQQQITRGLLTLLIASPDYNLR